MTEGSVVPPLPVIPAEAGVQVLYFVFCVLKKSKTWIPAYAGTSLDSVLRRNDREKRRSAPSSSSPRKRGSRSVFCIRYFAFYILCFRKRRKGKTWIPAYAGTGLDFVFQRNDNPFFVTPAEAGVQVSI